MYDKHYNLEEEYNYKTIDFVNEQVEHSEAKERPASSYSVLVHDCYMYDNKIVLLLLRQDPNNRPPVTYNKIIEFEIDKGIKINRILELPGRIYSTLCINDEYLFAFNTLTGSIEKHRLSFK